MRSLARASGRSLGCPVARGCWILGVGVSRLLQWARALVGLAYLPFMAPTAAARGWQSGVAARAATSLKIHWRTSTPGYNNVTVRPGSN